MMLIIRSQQTFYSEKIRARLAHSSRSKMLYGVFLSKFKPQMLDIKSTFVLILLLRKKRFCYLLSNIISTGCYIVSFETLVSSTLQLLIDPLCAQLTVHA